MHKRALKHKHSEMALLVTCFLLFAEVFDCLYGNNFTAGGKRLNFLTRCPHLAFLWLRKKGFSLLWRAWNKGWPSHCSLLYNTSFLPAHQKSAFYVPLSLLQLCRRKLFTCEGADRGQSHSDSLRTKI